MPGFCLFASDFGPVGAFLFALAFLSVLPSIFVTLMWPFAMNCQVRKRSKVAYICLLVLAWTIFPVVTFLLIASLLV